MHCNEFEMHASRDCMHVQLASVVQNLKDNLAKSVATAHMDGTMAIADIGILAGQSLLERVYDAVDNLSWAPIGKLMKLLRVV